MIESIEKEIEFCIVNDARRFSACIHERTRITDWLNRYCSLSDYGLFLADVTNYKG